MITNHLQNAHTYPCLLPHLAAEGIIPNSWSPPLSHLLSLCAGASPSDPPSNPCPMTSSSPSTRPPMSSSSSRPSNSHAPHPSRPVHRPLTPHNPFGPPSMARVTTVVNGVIVIATVMPRLEVLKLDLVIVSLLLPLQLIPLALTSTSPHPVPIASLTSIRETLPLVPPIISTIVPVLIITAPHVTIDVTFALVVVLTFVPPLITTCVPLALTMNWTSTQRLPQWQFLSVVDNTWVAMGYCHNSVKLDYHFLFLFPFL